MKSITLPVNVPRADVRGENSQALVEMACQYKNSLGVPGEGFHSARFMGLAVGDTVGTVILALIVARIFDFKFGPTLLFLFILGEILHWYFCVDSTVMKWVKKITKY
jgi:hypothetical protein